MGEKTVVCDTDVLIDYLNEKNVRNRTTTIIIEDIIGLDNVVISSVSKMELLVGAKNKFDLKSIEKQIKHFNVGLINNEIAIIAIDLVARYNLSHGLAIPDAFVAATSLYLNCPVFTYNLKDFAFIKGLILHKV